MSGDEGQEVAFAHLRERLVVAHQLLLGAFLLASEKLDTRGRERGRGREHGSAEIP